MIARGRRGGGPAGRRSGPLGERPWWDPHDQAFVEGHLLGRRDLGKGWTALDIVNNEERRDPFGEDPASERVRAARSARCQTALDEGRAWRRRSEGSLVVVRVEVFADAAPGVAAAHRAAWQAHGVACLDAVWRQRWKERDRLPGWIEARWKREVVGGAAEAADRQVAFDPPTDVDWIRVEDQTEVHDTGVVQHYEHLTVWAGRAHAILTVRHPQGVDLDATVRAAAEALRQRLGGLGA